MLPAGTIVNIAAGVVLALFGITVAIIGRARWPAIGVAAFSAGLGVAGVAIALRAERPHELLIWATTLSLLVMDLGLVVLAATFPRPLRRGDRGPLVAIVIVVALLVPTLIWGFPAKLARDLPAAQWSAIIQAHIMIATFGAVLIVFALRYRREAVDPFGLVVATVALLPYVGTNAGAWLLTSVDFELGVYTYVVLLAVAIVWLRAASTGSRAARNVALFALAIPVAVALASMTWPDVKPGFAARVWAAGVLGYGVLRHQLLGADVTVRFAISKTTIGAIFIAVFFIASEAAQQFLGSQVGGAYVGIAAAGLLVFAMAPLQRAAERLAEKAVPVATPAAAARDPQHAGLDIYRYALRAALADGRMTPDEELHLAEVAHRLRLTHPQAIHARREIEREMDHEQP